MKEKNLKDINLFLSIEDEAGMEDWPLPAIVPLVFSKRRNRIEAECYFGVYDIAREFFTEFWENPFSHHALAELHRRMQPYLEKEGYKREGGVFRYYRSFLLWEKGDFQGKPNEEHSALLTKALYSSVKVNKTPFDLGELLEKKLPAAVTVKQGELLSIATVNEHSEGQRLLEATVYTLPEHRQKGYALSNTALLCKYLLSRKKGVVYCCSCHNRPSAAIAKTLGFKNESRFYAVDAYRKED